MPAFPMWYPRAREILQILKDPNAPSLLDRRAVERLFRVRKRQAIRLLTKCGGYRLGQNFVVDHGKLVQYIEEAIQTGSVAKAVEKERAAHEKLEEAEKRRAAADAQFEPLPSPPADGLPSAAKVLGPGRLLINHQGAIDLIARMHELLKLAGKDFPNFQKLVG